MKYILDVSGSQPITAYQIRHSDRFPFNLSEQWYDLSREERLALLNNAGLGDDQLAKYYRKRIDGWVPSKKKIGKGVSGQVKHEAKRRTRFRKARVRMGLI